MQKKLTTIISLLCFIFLQTFYHVPVKAAFFDPKLKWKTVKTEHFNIHFHNGLEETAQKMASITEKVYADLSPRLKWKPLGRTEVILTDHVDVSNAFAKVVPYNQVLVYVTPPHGTLPLNNYDNWLEDLFTHEFTHILHMDKNGGIIKPFRLIMGKLATPNSLSPGWVKEGIAVFEESRNGKGRNNNAFTEMMLRTDILNDQFLKIDEAAGLKIGWPSAYAAYIYGGAFWQYLADTYGEKKVAEFINRYGRSIFLGMPNSKAKQTFHEKSFLKLWKEWKASLETKYAKTKSSLESKGITNLEPVVHLEGNIDVPTLSPDGKQIIYVKSDVHSPSELTRLDLVSQKKSVIKKGVSTNQISFSPDGKKIVYGALGAYKGFYAFNDLHEIDLVTKKEVQLTEGKRAADPDYSPDGKTIVFVSTKEGTSNLYLYDRESKKEKQITQSSYGTQFSNPRFSPNGKQIVVSAWINGQRDLYLYRTDGSVEKQITHDNAIDNEPFWSRDGKSVYFTSDRSGISNIYRQEIESDEAEQLSNVLTGVFHPQPISGTDQILTQHYFGKGYDAVRFSANRNYGLSKSDTPSSSKKKKSDGEVQIPSAGGKTARAPVIDDYNPAGKLFVPRYIKPGFFYTDGIGLVTLGLGSTDPLGRHFWGINATYRTDANFWGGDFTYVYNRWYTPFYVGFSDNIASYGDVFSIGKPFFEERRRVFGGIRIPARKSQFDLYYGFENRTDRSDQPPGAEKFLSLGRFGGFGLTYTFDNTKRYPASISPEGGPKIRLSAEVNQAALGSSEKNETMILEGDIRHYQKLPWGKHHVLALRASGGANVGDKLFQGVFRLGSDIGDSFGYLPQLYSLRGLPKVSFAGDRALLFSGEYRIPLGRVERGIATTPLFLKQMHLALFADYGSVFDKKPEFDKFLLGVGAELKMDWVIGYSLPITARLGYGRIIRGREFLGNRTDPVLGTSIKNGTLILQVGSGF